MSQSARDIILKRIDQACVLHADLEVQQEAEDLLKDSAHAPLLSTDPVEAFHQRILDNKVIGTSCSFINSIEELPAAAENYIKENDLPAEVAVQNLPLFEKLDWNTLNNTGPLIDGSKDGLLAVSFADFGIAETASVVFHSGKDRPVLLNFLCLHQIIVIKEKSILALMDDYAQHIDPKTPPRNTIWITGASGTTDIEGVLVQGAHGPTQVHIFILK
jgi:L-lactate dehydrogenase complex protein LldG